MIRRSFIMGLLALFAACPTFAQTKAPAPVGPIPTVNQLRWQEMEYYAFVHFSLNTYTDQSWGYGNEDINLFNPEKLDCRQWARICKQAGMKGIIVTAKHHSGFCLWPSKYTAYSVKNAPWKNGKGDVVRELADACKEYGLKLGIYVSPWDRNHPDYGKPEYITYFRNQIRELLTQYGPIFEIWFDGANGGTGYYGGADENRKIDRATYYQWPETYKIIRRLQPDCVIWNDGGDRADLRWVGTEEGYVGETNWSLLNKKGEPDWGMLHFGLENGDAWVPAEVNTSIRPEWFYHPDEDTKVKTVPQLMDTYYHSIGRNGTLLLNFPIMPNGLIHKTDELAALEMAAAVKKTFANNLALKASASAEHVRGNDKRFGAAMAIDKNPATYWATDDGVTTASLVLDLPAPVVFNRFLVQERISLGQRVKSFTVEVFADGSWKEVAAGTTIGYKRILRFPGVKASKLRFNIKDAKACPAISTIGLYNAPLFLNAPSVTRDQSGKVSITTNDIGPVFYYTLDGKVPTTRSKKYSGAFQADGKMEIRSIAVDPASGQAGPVTMEKFDVSKSKWKLVGTNDTKAYAVLDGNSTTAWHQQRKDGIPNELVIDLGEEHAVAGFRYLPEQGKWGSGIITHYRFYVSDDGANWTLADEGEFSNIRNNPLWQTKKFQVRKARYIKLQALKNTADNNRAGYAEVDIITQ
ncbi:alpha-L-fucosidase [Parasegetibacter sp. NRK P23]|uniref:alpha-L-fucosidase n=1 Tax=Parasegetibacter sp. NRK P23 TaxID=2942999 RepID=UPI0020439211|nr:alpha-L-fucosidase [Parasegetibacter sp. NRK P23]MCM5527577.1 alpha-L-fucosidase [Parasegetibacter sp. NRK P23]